jgi:SagB-type dehydrogenase family enzyme
MRTIAEKNGTEAAAHKPPGNKFELPLRPRFIEELVVAPTGDGIAVDGADQLHLVWGDTARNVLPDLIPLLDGTRTQAEISAALPHVPAELLRSVLSSFFSWGLVEEGSEAVSSDLAVNADTLSFFRRYLGATGLNRNGSEAYERLLTTEIMIAESGPVGTASQDLQLLLAQTGFSRIQLLGRESIGSTLSSATTLRNALIVSLSVAGEEGEDYEELARLDDICAVKEISWLRICIDEMRGLVDVGPLFDRKQRACYRCFTEMHCGTKTDFHSRKPLDIYGLKFWISLAAAEVVLRVSRLTPVDNEGFRRYKLQDWNVLSLRFAPIPGCPQCRPLSGGDQQQSSYASGRIDVGMLFEDYVSNRSRPSTPSKTDPTDLQMASELSRQSKRMPNSRQYSLAREIPELQRPILDVAAAGVRTPRALSLATLGSLLMMTAGIRRSWSEKPTVTRWAATGGNLGSVELFAAVRNVDGLPPGYYFYQPREHSLAVVRPHRAQMPIEEFIRESVSCDQPALPEAMIVFTGAFHRVSKKYGPFGYRLVNFDAGVALSQLQFLAKSMGIRAHIACRWADDLIERELSLEPLAEQITAAVLLNQDESTCVGSKQPNVYSEVPPSTRAAVAFCQRTVWDVLEMAYVESRVKKSELNRPSSPVPQELQHINYKILPASLPLPAPATGGAFVGDILRSRRSIRRYSPESLSMNQLSTMLSVAHHMDADAWPEEHRNGQSLTFLLLVQRVIGVTPGLYLYDSANHSLRLLREAFRFEELFHLYVQDEFALAPVAVWIVGNLAAACARHGAFGHRQLLLRAGAAGNQLWMAGLGMGLSGSLVAGIVVGSAARELGLDGYLKAGLLASTFGYSAPGRSTTEVIRSAGRAQNSDEQGP